MSFTQAARFLPGIFLCGVLTGASIWLQGIETHVFGRAWIEALVIAILLGTAIRTIWTPSLLWRCGIEFGAKTILEIAIVLLGATISAGAVLGEGLATLGAIVGAVAATICISYAIGKMFGLPHRMATLIACGNSICGNSAIAAVAPVIGADGEEIASSIAFTAVLGVVVVIALPLIALALHMTPKGAGVFAGLTVYAVPQVLAATAPIGILSTQVGTLVKLVRVLMLGPVILFISFFSRADRDETDEAAPAITAGDRPKRGAPALHQLVPWFIIGFLLLIAARSAAVIPDAALAPASKLAGFLTIVSMAALGLGVDVRVVARAGLRVTTVVTLSLIVLGTIALLLIYGLRLG
ncbi:MAG TPA: putative sulfate exporter family transporter [Rhizomicrobium sp.]|jgi:uncharacterized integral membrane protein (TIGR00698 family)